MRLFTQLNKAQQNELLENGPDESQRVQQTQIARLESHQENKGEELVQAHCDSKLDRGLANMRIDEVEDEQEQTCNDDDERAQFEDRIDYYREQDVNDSYAFGEKNFADSPKFSKMLNGQAFKAGQEKQALNQSINSQGLACINVDPDNVQPLSPDPLNESLKNISPKTKIQHHNVVEIFVDRDSPIK